MEIVVRVSIIYLVILLGMRLLGKRELGQLSPFELVTLLLIPEIATDALIDQDPSITGSIIGIATILVLVFLTSLLSHGSRRAEKLLEGTPTVLVHHGQLVGEALNKERVTPGEIFTEMHKAGLERLEQVRWAVLEPDGKIAIIAEEESKAVQRQEQEVML